MEITNDYQQSARFKALDIALELTNRGALYMIDPKAVSSILLPTPTELMLREADIIYHWLLNTRKVYPEDKAY